MLDWHPQWFPLRQPKAQRPCWGSNTSAFKNNLFLSKHFGKGFQLLKLIYVCLQFCPLNTGLFVFFFLTFTFFFKEKIIHIWKQLQVLSYSVPSLGACISCFQHEKKPRKLAKLQLFLTPDVWMCGGPFPPHAAVQVSLVEKEALNKCLVPGVLEAAQLWQPWSLCVPVFRLYWISKSS